MSKTVLMRFGNSDISLQYEIDGNIVKQVEGTKDLGVFVDQKFSFKEHCIKIVKNSNFLCYNLLKIFNFCDCKNKFCLFKTYIRPIIEYNVLFYYPMHKQNILILENVQKRFTKRICPKGLCYNQRLDLFGDMSIQKSAMINALIFMYKVIFLRNVC